MTDIDERLESLQKQIDELDDTDERQEFADDIEKFRKELDEHDAKPAPEDVSSDEWYEYQNKRTEIMNKIRTKMGLKPQDKMRLDEELEQIIAIGAEKELIESLMDEDEKGNKIKTFESREMQQRLEGIEFQNRLETGIENKQVDRMAKLSRLLMVVKERPHEDTPAYKEWKDNIVQLKNRVDKLCRAEENKEHEVIDYKADRRKFPFSMQKAVAEITKGRESELGLEDKSKEKRGKLMSEESWKSWRFV